jgi:hypothetical protein
MVVKEAPIKEAPQFENLWKHETDWLGLIEFLRSDNEENRARGAVAIGHMFAYAQMTDTRMLALVGDAKEDVYELLFSFNSAANKARFLRLLQSNDATACEEDEILVPHASEIAAAQPIAEVLPEDVLQRVSAIAAMLLLDGPETLQ